MKYLIKNKIIGLLLGAMMIVSSCETDFPNPNNPTEETILSTKDGIFALSIGMHQYFITSCLRQYYEAPGITTRELGVTNTFLNINELARGGTELPPESGGITNPWVVSFRAKGMAESIIANADNADLSEGSRAGVLVWAHFHKAAILGYSINMFEQVPVDNNKENMAEFNTRTAVLEEAIQLLEDAKTLINTTGISSDFQNNVIGPDINMEDVVNAFLSRYYLLNEQYPEAIAAAEEITNQADPAASYYSYDPQNNNPIWSRTVVSADLNPQTNLGLQGPYVPEAGDARVDFYLGADAGFANADAGGQALSEMEGFFSTSTSPIPVYLYGEVWLNMAEAYARNNDLPNAVIALNAVRQKTAAADPYGLGADLPAWGGNAADQNEVLEEIYKNRCIEGFLTGMRLADSRRFHPNFDPTSGVTTQNERNRNFYPYPFIERENNPNTPADPAI